MSAPPVEIFLKDYYKGDTWIGISVGPIKINGLQPSATIVSCRMHFRDKKLNLGCAFSSKTSSTRNKIIINDSVTWELSILPAILPLDVGEWDWDLEILDSDGVNLTYYHGTLTVLQDKSF